MLLFLKPHPVCQIILSFNYEVRPSPNAAIRLIYLSIPGLMVIIVLPIRLEKSGPSGMIVAPLCISLHVHFAHLPAVALGIELSVNIASHPSSLVLYVMPPPGVLRLFNLLASCFVVCLLCALLRELFVRDSILLRAFSLVVGLQDLFYPVPHRCAPVCSLRVSVAWLFQRQ